MVNLVIVSHSARLGEGVGELVRQMLSGKGCRLAIAAGIDDPDSPIGTDPVRVMEAIESVAQADHVLVMMDIGSALLSAETALDLLDPAVAAKVRLCAAPLVEGALAAAVSADAGADIDSVIADAEAALGAKRAQLGLPAVLPAAEAPAAALGRDARAVSVVVKNRNGLHLRPASALVAALAGFDAQLVLEKEGRCVAPDSINQIALLQVRQNDRVRLLASGPDADAALAAFKALAARDFGERPAAEAPAGTPPVRPRVSGRIVLWTLPDDAPAARRISAPVAEQRRLRLAIDGTLDDLTALAALAGAKYGGEIAAIFSGHRALLDDAELYQEVCALISREQTCAEWAWQQVMSAMSRQYRQLDDAYLRARSIDVDDILQRTLSHLRAASAPLPAPAGPAIIVSDDIFPSTVLQLDPSTVGGVCLRRGSPLSHGAIIAREAGIAFICQQGGALDAVQEGQHAVLDVAAQRLILA